MNNHSNGQHYDAGEQQSAQLTSPTALRKLVLNYLVHHCYTDTAQAFAHDGISSTSTRTHPGEAISSTVNPSSSSSSSSISKRPRNGADLNNGSSSVASSSTQAPQTRSLSRLANQQSTAPAQAHPLSAPSLSREDSSMEVEVDSLLSLAGSRDENGSSNTTNGHTAKEMKKETEDVRMGDGQIASTEEELNSDELSIEELRSVRTRKEIKDNILEGRIKQAVDLCNTFFPTVLNADPTSSNSIENEQNKAVKTNVKERDPGNGGLSNGDSPRILPANPTSLYAAHLSLNLQIQAFIESVRSASHAVSSNGSTSQLLSASSTGGNNNSLGSLSATPHSLAASAPGITSAAATVLSRSASPAPSSSSSTGSAASANGLSGSTHSNGSAAVLTPVLHAALSHAQMLFANVQKLPGYWRAMYLKELESVTALLAYTDLETSPVRKYLDQSRRVALAEQINSAIMFRTEKPSQPLIESAVRQTSFLWSTLSNEKIMVPTDHPIFTSGTVIGVDKFELQTVTSGNGTDRSKSKGKILPSWNLHNFLLER